MRRLAAISAVLLAACASASQGPSTVRPDQTVRVVNPGVTNATAMSVTQSDDPSQRIMPVPSARIWDALPAVYDSLGLPITDRNVQDRSIGTTSFKVRRKLGNAPLSRYLDCGATQGSPSADSYEVLLTVMTRLAPSGDTTAVITRVDALARPVFVSGEYVNCGSTRALEKRFFDLLTTEVNR